jgi:hypothetical protein
MHHRDAIVGEWFAGALCIGIAFWIVVALAVGWVS